SEGCELFVQLVSDSGLDARDLRARCHCQTGVLALQLSDSREDIALDAQEFFLRDFPQLEAHLCFEELPAERRAVERLRLGRCENLVQNEAEAADQNGVEDEH